MTERKMWEQKEDNMIRKIVKENQNRSQQQKWKWSEIAEILQRRISGCNRTGKQCRERWFNHLNPAIIKDKELSQGEIDKLFELQDKIGNRWAHIARQFPGRTDNNLKNFFYSSLRRAIRQINHYVAQFKKKSNIKPFKQSILTKILNISDQKYKQKLDIKSQRAETLAHHVKCMLAKLSLEQQGKQIDQSDLQFRQKIVKSIQQFNKNCKKRKSKKASQQEQPDLQQINQINYQNYRSESSQPKLTRKRTPIKQKKINIKQQNKQSKPTQRNKVKPTKKQSQIDEFQTKNKRQQQKNLFKNPYDDLKLNKSKSSYIEEMLANNQQKLKQMQSKKSSSKYDSRSSGNQHFKIQSSEFMRQSNSFHDLIQPRMLTRRSSEQKPNFISNLENWRKMESRYDNSLFAPPDNMMMLDPMLESINIGQNIQKIQEGSLNQSGFLKMFRNDSKTDRNSFN